MRRLLSVLLLCSASVASAAGPRVDIVIGDKAPPLERRAAEELAADLKRLYEADARIASEVPSDAPNVILVGSPATNAAIKQVSDQLPKLSEQGHAVLSGKYNGRPVLAVAGGSPAATYWAAAELAHQWGVRTMLYGDVDPVAPPEFSVEGLDIVREPLAKTRSWQMNFDSLIGAASWSLDDQQKLLRQLARLKFNRLVLSTKAESPAAAVASLAPIAVSGDTAGRSAFGGAKFLDNPDLAGATSDDARLKAAGELIRGIEKEAKELGMSVVTARTMGNTPLPAGSTLPLLFVRDADEWLRQALSKRDTIGLAVSAVGDADLAAFIHARGCFDTSFVGDHPMHDLVTPICGAGVSDRVLKAFELAEDATKLILTGDRALGASEPDVVMKHYASSDPPPEWWAKARDNYLNAMNEMYRANTRAREGGRSYTLYFARRFEFAFEYMNAIEAVRKAGIAKSNGDSETQIAELEKAVESLNGACNAMAAVARSPSDRGIIAAINEFGYRPLVKELDAAGATSGN